ncbi:MAG: nitroreductase family protein [Gammaproteobacteria bacterium]|nr:nitroreductase family protein [Gammaproteobacteria bacterium]
METDRTAETSEPIHPLLARRWSPLAFDEARPVEREKLLSIMEAARWAPSCFNEQPWRYLLCDRFSDPQSWSRALGCLVPGNQRWAERAPVLIAALSHKLFQRNGKTNRWSAHDNGAASENMCLQACELGLAVHQMGGFDADRLLREFKIPGSHQANAMIALGYPGDPATLSDNDRRRQEKPRERDPIGSIAFLNAWGVGIR